MFLDWINREEIFHLKIVIYAQSAGAVEHTDCTSTGEKPPTNECPEYGTKQYHGEVPVMLKLW